MANKTWIGTDGNYGTAGNWSPSGVPTTGDSVYIPAGGGSITSGLDQSAVTDVAKFEVAAGYTGTIGSAAGYLQIDLVNSTGIFIFAGTGTAYIDLGNSAVAVNVRDTAVPLPGFHGLYLKGSGLTTLNAIQGDIGLAAIFGETSTLTTARAVTDRVRVHIGSGTTLTTFYQTAGDNQLDAAATTVTVWGGTLTTRGVGAVTTMTVYDGTVYPESTGTITTLNANGGDVVFNQSGASRTVTTLAHNYGATVVYDPNVLTITNRSAPNGPVRASLSLA